MNLLVRQNETVGTPSTVSLQPDAGHLSETFISIHYVVPNALFGKPARAPVCEGACPKLFS